MNKADSWEESLTQTTAFRGLDLCYQAPKIVARASILESFKFEDENKYEYEISLKVFARVLKK